MLLKPPTFLCLLPSGYTSLTPCTWMFATDLRRAASHSWETLLSNHGTRFVSTMPLIISRSYYYLNTSQAWWLTLVIPALWEAEAGRSRGLEFKISLANTAKPRLY